MGKRHPDKTSLFALLGHKELLKSDMEYDVILIDATETPIERPKKTKTFLLREEEKAHLKDAAHCLDIKRLFVPFFSKVEDMILEYLRSLKSGFIPK